MSIKVCRTFVAIVALALVSATLLVRWQFDNDMQRARAHAAQDSVLLATRCGGTADVASSVYHFINVIGGCIKLSFETASFLCLFIKLKILLCKIHHASHQVFKLYFIFKYFFTDQRIGRKTVQYKLHE